MKTLRQVCLSILIGLGLVFILKYAGKAEPAIHFNIPATSIKLYEQKIGTTTHYIGACEGSVAFNSSDFLDLGLNTYRIYGGMSRWEPEDDDGVYGFPSIAQLKANPNLIPWEQWDTRMTTPEMGSDYAFSGHPPDLWQGSARTIFETLRQEKIRPVVTIRNSDPGWSPSWALQLNPPRTEADWNEWWEHVFATVYWLNVRNDYQVDDFEIHNEPDNRQQGWGGTQEDYFELVRVASDAIAHVYTTYLPDRAPHIHAPKTTGGSSWPADILALVPTDFNHVNMHTYDWDVSNYVRQVRHWMRDSVHDHFPLWVGEWGTYTDGYDDLNFSLNLIKNMIRMAQPGDTHVDGSHLFSLYDWGRAEEFKGLIDAEGDHRLSYYAFRMGIRALQGGRDVLLSTLDGADLMAIATRNKSGHTDILMINDQQMQLSINLDVSPIHSLIGPTTELTLWEFSRANLDEIVAHPRLDQGTVSLTIPEYSAFLLQFISDD